MDSHSDLGLWWNYVIFLLFLNRSIKKVAKVWLSKWPTISQVLFKKAKQQPVVTTIQPCPPRRPKKVLSLICSTWIHLCEEHCIIKTIQLSLIMQTLLKTPPLLPQKADYWKSSKFKQQQQIRKTLLILLTIMVHRNRNYIFGYS